MSDHQYLMAMLLGIVVQLFVMNLFLADISKQLRKQRKP